jgi:signal transduction histidine kinase
LATATGAIRADVWLLVGRELRCAASWPDPDVDVDAVPLDGDELPWLPADWAAEVRDRGELVGALAVDMPPNDPIGPGRQRLIRDLAAQAGLAIRNVRLVEDLRASRRRIVTTQDERAKTLERNIHDGAQQQLVALAVKQRLLGDLIGRNDEQAQTLADQLQSDTNDALENLRDLARGIYPPLLADQGLGAALEAQARKAATPTSVRSGGIGRFPQEIESAVYFSCLEALQNVAKYAGASTTTITLANGENALSFSIADDGIGFDPAATSYGTGLQGIADRLAAIGGTLSVTSAPGAGTTIEGAVPA